MKRETMDKLDFVSSIVLTAFGIGVLVESLRLPRLEDRDINPFTVPGIVPGMLGCLLTVCGIVILVRSVARGGWRLGVTVDQVAAFLRLPVLRRVGVTLVLTLGYALGLFGRLPFWLATSIFVSTFIIVTEALADPRRIRRWPCWAIAAAIGLSTGLIVETVFVRVFFVRLP